MERVERECFILKAGDHDDGRIQSVVEEVAQGGGRIGIGQGQIEEHQIKLAFGQILKGQRDAVHVTQLIQLEASMAAQPTKYFGVILFVFNEE